ncbi:rhophilin-1 [Phlebotomus argentipes]|uniref:rhophilin-1 n=1 Tax=Phlebotomus argentipes TaxID=94469 RepID=UPI00289336EF|nr:rhophilin-1 [Phlebotomus argentipes]XP_059618505.1 rhophilin-1 [Phlebotomus argentipes]XP_059618506.1 rhophilin-1 [Phlebotomus argentipes]
MESKTDNRSFSFIRGSDPRVATCRGKLQSRRCKLNQEINKELRLRAGAENLYKATSNRKLKDTVALELSFVNSNLQLLKEQLSELNSSVEIYQNDGADAVIPMIPLGLKETKEVNFLEPLADFILEHYSEDSSCYEDAIADITDTRQGARTPTRDSAGVALLFRYYNLLYYVERRFFPPDRSLGVYFEWYDSLTGVPSCQRTVAFEKACVLFNLGAIYTQIGTRQDRSSEKGLDAAVDSFLRAAGIFKHIYDTFTNAPSMDLKPQVLEILVALMLAQARECLFEKLRLQMENMSFKDVEHLHRDLSGESAQLTMEYNDMHMSIQSSETHTYLPECWAGLVPLKAEYYKALSHYHAAKSISTKPFKKSASISPSSSASSKKSVKASDSFIFDESSIDADINPVARKRAHLNEALASHDEAQRLQRMCRELKNKSALTKILHRAYIENRDEMDKFSSKTDQDDVLNEEFDLVEAHLDTCSKFTLSLTGPDFTAYKVEDPFKKLGPIAIFSARRHWTAPRSIRLQKGTSLEGVKTPSSRKTSTSNAGRCQCKKSPTYDSGRCEVCAKYIAFTAEDSSSKNQSSKDNVESFGFHVRGDAPVIISYVELNSLADLGGIKDGDFIVELSGIDVKWYTQEQVVNIIQSSGSSLDIKVITPMDRNYLKPTPGLNKGSVSTLSGGSSSGVSSGAPSPNGTTSKPKSRSKSTKSRLPNLSGNGWNIFRRTQSLGKIY